MTAFRTRQRYPGFLRGPRRASTETAAVGHEAISAGGYRFVILWGIGLMLVYLCDAYSGAMLLRRYAEETGRVRRARIEAALGPPPVASPPSGAKPVDVLVALRVNRIGELALKESAWTADFKLSFRWTGNSLNPGESFRIANGQILERERRISNERNGEHYEEYKVVARIVKPFDASRFPVGDEGLVIGVEDPTRGTEAVRYVADERNSGVGPEALPESLKLSRTLVGVKRRSWPRQADTGDLRSDTEVYSHFFLAMLVAPDTLGIYQKVFQALFASVAVALIALHIKPIHVDPRFGLPVGGFFASVTNNVFVAGLVPYSDRLTLADLVNATGLFTILIILVESAVSLYILDTLGQARLSRLLDRISFAVILVGYVVVNLVLPLAARPV